MIADSVAEFLGHPTNAAVLERLRAAGVTTESPGARPGRAARPAAAAAADAGRAVGRRHRHAAGLHPRGGEEAIVARGGKSPGTVSKKTFAVVVGDAPGAPS